MKFNEFKLIFWNMAVFFMSYTDLESFLKIVLLIVSIGFTAYKWISVILNKRKIKDETGIKIPTNSDWKDKLKDRLLSTDKLIKK